jgi:DNA-directed RNA polymerase subunit N (RpoN/RPB10)
MIIPVKCFTCGNVLANKYKYYQRTVRERKQNKDQKVVYLTPENTRRTYEAEVLDELKLTKLCCRRHMMTHVDII